jgi:hypothetical protein
MNGSVAAAAAAAAAIAVTHAGAEKPRLQQLLLHVLKDLLSCHQCTPPCQGLPCGMLL